MNYNPKRIDTPVRALYAMLLIWSVVLMSIFKTGAIGIISRSVSIIMMSAALYLFIRYDMTTYTYIINEKGTDFEFIINKAVGRRGNYVCYCYMSNCVFFEKCTENTKKELKNKYSGISSYNFMQNVIKKSEYVIVFKNETGYDAVYFEPNEEFARTISDAKEKAVTLDFKENNEESTDNEN